MSTATFDPAKPGFLVEYTAHITAEMRDEYDLTAQELRENPDLLEDLFAELGLTVVEADGAPAPVDLEAYTLIIPCGLTGTDRSRAIALAFGHLSMHRRDDIMEPWDKMQQTEASCFAAALLTGDLSALLAEHPEFTEGGAP